MAVADDGIALKGVCFSYAPDRWVLRELDLAFAASDRVALLGANGSGKTTLLHVLVGLLRPGAGEVAAFGQVRRTERDFAEVRRRMGLLFQDPDDQLFCPTVAEDVAFGPLNLGRPRADARAIVDRTLESLGLAGYGRRITYRLSGGERRLVSLATVLAMEPDVLLLDEPTINLDGRSRQHLIEILAARHEGLLLVTHDLPMARRLCSRFVVLGGGRIAASGTAEEVLDNAALLVKHGLT
jgi:cobalt/nickel transport system ATP-binding protein